MDKLRILSVLGMGLLLSQARSLSQEPFTLPPPGAPYMVEVMPMNVPAAAEDGGSHGKLQRLWRFITFQYPPRPRECRECVHTSSRCTAPLYEYFENRYPRQGSD